MIGVQADRQVRPVIQPGRAWLPQWRNLWWLWLMLLALLVGGAALLVLLRQPVVTPTNALGLYAREGEDRPYFWTSYETVFPVKAGTAATEVSLTLTAANWPGRDPAEVAFASDATGELVRFVAPEQARTYHVLLPPNATEFRLHSSVAQPSGDPRWLGVQLLDIRAEASGWPLWALGAALAWALLSVAVALVVWWCARCGYGWLAAITLLGLALRLIQLDHVPTGYFQDEAVSLVDAWHLSRTAHDHLGHFLPLGALESFGDWVSPLLAFVSLPFVAIFGPQMMVGRLIAAVAGSLAIPAGYGLARALRLPWVPALIVALAVAISPWQILRTRAATPPALLPFCWMLCLWAAVEFVRRGDRRSAFWLVLAAGPSLYGYPTMKMAVPLLGAVAVVLALWRHGWGAIRTWLPAGVLLLVFWLPFFQVTLFNADSGMRAQSKLLRADTPLEWVSLWLQGYGVYWSPSFYYLTGDASNGLPNTGVQLPIEAPLVILGLVLLIARCVGRTWGHDEAQPRDTHLVWWLIVGALLISPLPASLMTPNPQMTRALLIAPLYALLVGLGAALLWEALGRWVAQAKQAQFAVMAVVAVALLWQGGLAYNAYLTRFPEAIAGKYQDGLAEAMAAAVHHAPDYDQVWIDDRMPFPYIFVLAAQPMPPAEAQALIEVEHGGTTFNTVHAIGPYRFMNLAKLPYDLPVVAAMPTSLGRPGFILQEWQAEQQRVLLVRRMRVE